MKREILIDMGEYSCSVLGRVDGMRIEKRYCDFLIKAGSKEIHAHQIILAGGSEYFDKMLKFALNNFLDISKQEEFVELEKDYIKKIIKSRKAKMSEAEKLDVILRWTRHVTERRQFLLEMVKLVKLDGVPVSIRRHLIESEPLINGNNECILLLSISVMDSIGVKQECLGPLQQSQSGIVIFDEYSGHLHHFSPRNDSWTKMQEMNDDMKTDLFTSIRLENHIYVLMENKSVYRLKFSDETATWERIADMIEDPGGYPPAVALLGEIFIIGESCGIASNVLQKFRPDSNQWTRLPDKPYPTDGSAIVELQGCIYSFGGHDDDGNLLNTVEVFSPSSLAWKVVGSMNESKCSASAVEINGKIYVLGGVVGLVPLSTVECFDIETNECKMLKSMNVARHYPRGVVVDGAIYAVGGIGTEDSIEKYDVSEDKWKMVQLPNRMKLRIKESVQI